jgi:hypothetical protein
METYPPNPKVREGSPTDIYIRCCHERIWKLIDALAPHHCNVGGDCLEVADQILQERGYDKHT